MEEEKHDNRLHAGHVPSYSSICFKILTHLGTPLSFTLPKPFNTSDISTHLSPPDKDFPIFPFFFLFYLLWKKV